VTLLGEALEAMYRSRWSFRTLRAAGVGRGERHRLWVARPDRSRAEEDREDGTAVIVRNHGRWWMWSPEHGGMFGNDEEVSLGHEGALMHLLDPTPLLGVALLEATRETHVLGRRAAVVPAFPRSAEEVIEPGWYIGSEGIELAIDLERGIALRAGDLHLDEVAFDEDLDTDLFVLEFPEGEQPKESRIAPPRVLDLDEASAAVSFRVLVPRALPNGSRLVRCLVPGEGPPDGLHIVYVVDPGALHTIEISQGPRVAEEERTAWSDWRTVMRDGDELLVREDVGESWYRAMVLLERHETTTVVSSDLPLETVIDLARSLEPIR
jgi:hypothetical protein